MTDVCPKAEHKNAGHSMRLTRSGTRELWKCIRCGLTRIDADQISRQEAAALLSVEWQPMETAPSDTPILVHCPEQGVFSSQLKEGKLHHPTNGSRKPWPNTVWAPKPIRAEVRP